MSAAGGGPPKRTLSADQPKLHPGGSRGGAVEVRAIADHEALRGAHTEALRRQEVPLGGRLQARQIRVLAVGDHVVDQVGDAEGAELAARGVVADDRGTEAAGAMTGECRAENEY